MDLEDHDEIGRYLNDHDLVIVYEPDGVDIRPMNDVRLDQKVEPVPMGQLRVRGASRPGTTWGLTLSTEFSLAEVR